MPYIKPILKLLGGQIYTERIQVDYLASDSQISLLPGRYVHKDHSILIGHMDAVLQCLYAEKREQFMTAIVTDADETLDVSPLFPYADNVVSINADSLAVYAQFLSKFHIYHVWRAQFNSDFSYSDPSTFLPALSKKVDAAVFIYSVTDGILMDYSTYAYHNEFTEAMKKSRHLPDELQQVCEQGSSGHPVFHQFANGIRFALQQLTDKKQFSIWLVLIYETRLAANLPPDDLFYILAGQFERHLDFQVCFRHIPPPTTCDNLLEAIMENTVTDPYLLAGMASQLDHPMQRYIGFLYLTFPKVENPELYLRSMKDELQTFFPMHNIGYCSDAIVIFISSVSHDTSFLEQLEETAFPAWLEEKNAYACISCMTQFWERLRTQLLMAKSCCALGIATYEEKRHLMSVTQLQPYQMIELCTRSFREIYGHDDIIYLTHPAVITLTRYDKENDTKLRDTLFYYLLHDCDVNKTASVLFMHRNTIRNQIQKAQRIGGFCIDDPQLRQNLLFSCRIIKYYENVLRHSLNLNYIAYRDSAEKPAAGSWNRE